MNHRNIEKRLSLAIEKMRLALTKCKAYVIRTDEEMEDILKSEQEVTHKFGELIDVNNIVIFINCKEYDGKHRKCKN